LPVLVVETVIADEDSKLILEEVGEQNFLGLIANVLQLEGVDRLVGGEHSSLPKVSL